MSGTQCHQGKESNLNTVAQALLLCDNQQADAIDIYLQQKFHKTVTVVRNLTNG